MILRFIAALLLFLLCAFAPLRETFCRAASAHDPPRPNILLVLADDLGWSDLGCYGGEIRTPHLDKLAASGLRFTQFYNSTRCCPSRASLLTGLYPHQAGLGLMTNDTGLPGYRGALQPNCVTIAQALKSAGYKTAMTGKWHVGDNVSPIDRGFDDFYGWTRGYGVNSWEPRMMTRLPAGRPARTNEAGKFFATDALTDQALDFLAGMRKESAPWFLYVAYQAPHFPLHSLPLDMQGYAGVYAKGWDAIRDERLARQMKIGLLPNGSTLTPRSPIPHPVAARRMGSLTADGDNPPWDSLPADRRTDLAQRMAVYAGMVTGMDRNIGRLLADLGANGELENTLVLFLSDNGACAEWEPFGFDLPIITDPQPGVGINQGTQAAPNVLRRTPAELASLGGPESSISYSSAWANASATPWRLYKHYCHEGGIGTPFIAHWPAKISTGGEYRPQVGHLIDIMATCLDVSGAKYPAELAGHKITPLEGTSLVPAFENQPLKRDFLAFEHEGNAAIRVGDWKLVRQGATGRWELYNLATDRVELHDLATQEPQRVSDLSAKWHAWAERCQVLPYPDARPAAASKKTP
jgi:arylsulfatase A-like enzyme